MPRLNRTPSPNPSWLLKVQCGGCGWTARVAAKWVTHAMVDGLGAPCPSCGDDMLTLRDAPDTVRNWQDWRRRGER